jgi:hypothetical protein
VELNATRVYRKPNATVLVYGDITPSIVEKLKSLLRVYGSRGLRVILASQNTIRALDSLRDFLHENYAFTVEVYTHSSGFLGEAGSLETAGEVVAVLVSSSDLAKNVPSFLQDKVVVVT